MATKDLLRSFLATFGAVFLAELGDKTQLATMALSGAADSAKARWMIFLAGSLALVATSALGVLAGGIVARYVRPITVDRLAGGLFVVLGAWLLFKARG